VPERQFVVRAGEVKVIAVGTRFKVTRHEAAEHGVSVDVEQGVVEVHAAGKIERLLAGQHWESVRPEPRAEAPVPEAIEPTKPLPSDVRGAHEPSNPHEQPKAAAPSGSVVVEETAERADARKLFELANHARRAGDMRGAASGYEELLRRYPKDGRATLAALELGRLRMDHLGDNAGAISALNRAARSGGGSVREDAMARLVRAYAATGSKAQCLRARENYERSYPEGHHRAEVRAACGAR
jgi:TolA-binding protein